MTDDRCEIQASVDVQQSAPSATGRIAELLQQLFDTEELPFEEAVAVKILVGEIQGMPVIEWNHNHRRLAMMEIQSKGKCPECDRTGQAETEDAYF